MRKTLTISLLIAATMIEPAFANVNNNDQPNIVAETVAPAHDIELTGCIVDSLTHEGEPMATLRVWKQGEPHENSKASAMGTTDENGNFSLQLKQEGQYVLVVSSIGRKSIVKSLSVNEELHKINLGTILISESSEELQDVVVTVQRPLVKMEGDKIAYSVKDDHDAKTNTLLEMLRKVPMVTVDGEDNIQVNGSSNFQILMNGKPSPMLSGNPKETLKAIPAQSVKHIEVLTNPGAKYDAEGVGGILNFITDQQQDMEGYTGSISAQTGNRNNGGSVYAMIQKDKLTLSVNASEMYINMPKMENDNIREDLINHSAMTSHSIQEGGNNMVFANVDANYQIDEHNTVSANVSVIDLRSKLETDMTTSTVPGNTYNQTNNNKTDFTSLNTSVDYVHTFGQDPLHSLTTAYRFSTQPRKNDAATTYDMIDLPDYKHIDKNNMLEQTLQLDYVHPLSQNQTWEAGGKYVWRKSSSTSDLLDYEHQNSIGALYTTYSQTLGKFMMKGGLRYEFTSQDVEYKMGNGEDFSLTYNNLVPNLTLSFAPDMSKNLTLSYNMRISRPGISVLNPYRNTQMIHSVSYGNPNLDVETSHNTQFTYSYFSTKAMINASLHYSYQDNGIEQYSYLDNGVLYSTYANIGQRQNASLSIFASLSLTPKTRLTLNSTTSYVDLRAKQIGYSNNGWTQSAMANLQQNLPWNTKLSLMYMVNTPSVTLQGKTAGLNVHTIGLTKSCLNERLNFSVNAINPLNSTMKMKVTSEGEGYTNVNETRIKISSFIVSVSYRFGDLKMRQQKHTKQLDRDVLEVKDSNEQMNGIFQSK